MEKFAFYGVESKGCAIALTPWPLSQFGRGEGRSPDRWVSKKSGEDRGARGDFALGWG